MENKKNINGTIISEKVGVKWTMITFWSNNGKPKLMVGIYDNNTNEADFLVEIKSDDDFDFALKVFTRINKNVEKSLVD